MRYPDRLASLALETLPTRRLKYNLQMCYKVIHNQISVLNDDFLVFVPIAWPGLPEDKYKLHNYKGYSSGG